MLGHQRSQKGLVHSLCQPLTLRTRSEGRALMIVWRRPQPAAAAGA